MLILWLSYNNFSKAYEEECIIKGISTEDCSLIDKIIEDFKHVNYYWILLISVLFMISNIFRSLRWKQLLAPLGYQPKLMNALGATMIGYLANLGLPRMGEIIKPGILTKYDGIPIEKGMGTIVIDRILDVIALLLIILFAILMSFKTFKEYFKNNFSIDSMQNLKYLVLLVVVAFVILFFLNRFLKTTDSEDPLVIKVKSIWLGFKDGLKSVTRVQNFPLLVLYSALIWLMYYLMTYFCFFAYAPTMNFGLVAALVVFVFGTLGIVFPSPGGMGSYHFLVSQALIIYGLNSADAFSFSNIIFFTIQIFGNIFFGVLFLIILPIYNKNNPGVQ